jgi:hypothetical protein
MECFRPDPEFFIDTLVYADSLAQQRRERVAMLQLYLTRTGRCVFRVVIRPRRQTAFFNCITIRGCFRAE